MAMASRAAASANATTANGRRALVERVGSIAGQAGYNGAQLFKLRDGSPVGRWLRKTGVRIDDLS